MHMSPEAQAGPKPAPPSRRRVLVASSESRVRATAAQAVESAGFEAVQARTGAEALLADAEQLSAVVLDIELPDIDGFRVCRQLRASAGPAALPVIYLCAPGVPLQSRYAALESGAQACLMQPLDPVVLVSLLKALLDRPAAPLGDPKAATATLQAALQQSDAVEAAVWRVLRHRVDDGTLVALNTALHGLKAQRQLLNKMLGRQAG